MKKWRYGLDAITSRRSKPDAENAWNTLLLINDWIKHAEIKAAAALTACGVLGGALFTLVRTEFDSGVAFRISAIVCAILLLASWFSASMALRPRTKSSSSAINLLYYDHVATIYRARPDAYINDLSDLIQHPDALTTAISQQIWANAAVAHRKFLWGNAGITGLLLSLPSLSAAAIFSLANVLLGRVCELCFQPRLIATRKLIQKPSSGDVLHGMNC
ncbi:Pycsar system effector family protein [Glycomyces sp. MUSA5-2]|uniref:Pycsar system effector family protein n=1 Tax=Glycomyces sp. MUSA5-2 TaxID=2053002 RepID=UPI0030087169